MVLDEEGLIEDIVASERNVAHRLIEEFMLLANETVARHLETQRHAGALPHSRAARPAEGRWSSRSSSRSLGFSLGGAAERGPSRGTSRSWSRRFAARRKSGRSRS